jgi:hypothetical protein
MITETICILANSVKFKARCVAGMEVVSTGEHRWKLTFISISPPCGTDGAAIVPLPDIACDTA